MTDTLAAEIAAIRERSDRPLGLGVGALAISSDPVRFLMESAADVPRLLAALEAAMQALERHQQVITDSHGTICAGCLYPVPCPDTARVLAALTGKEGGDE